MSPDISMAAVQRGKKEAKWADVSIELAQTDYAHLPADLQQHPFFFFETFVVFVRVFTAGTGATAAAGACAEATAGSAAGAVAATWVAG